MQVKTYFVYSYHELEELIQNAFDAPNYEILAAEECSNDTDRTYNIKNEPLDEWEVKDIEKFKASKGQDGGEWRLGTLLQALVVDGIIPAGNYLMEVCW